MLIRAKQSLAQAKEKPLQLCSGFRILGECRGAYSVTKFSGNCLFAFSTSLLVSP